MKRLLVIASTALAAAVTSLVVVSQAAAAPDQTGQSFAEAKAALSAAGYNPVVATSFGDKLPQDECTVVRQETTTAAPFQGGGTKGVVTTDNGSPKVLLSLNCNPQPK